MPSAPTVITPGEQLQELVVAAKELGSPFVSAERLQAGLFEIYDAAANVPSALELTQQHLKLTLDRTWFTYEQVGELGSRIDDLLLSGALTQED
jgi:hypothetical protein